MGQTSAKLQLKPSFFHINCLLINLPQRNMYVMDIFHINQDIWWAVSKTFVLSLVFVNLHLKGHGFMYVLFPEILIVKGQGHDI
jgi:hypothetical protein